MGRWQGITQDKVLKAIDSSAGIVLTVSKRLGCDWTTAKKLIERWDKTREAMDAERQKLLDVGEGHLAQAVYKGDLSIIKWLMDRLGKERGYGADPISMMAEQPLKIEFEGQTTRETMETSPDIEISNGKESGADTE